MARINMDDAEPTLMEFGMQQQQNRAVTPGGSKRKRSQSGLAYAAYLSAGSEAEPDSHTPKRNRSTNWPLTESQPSSDGPDVRQRSVRRKHGKYGLSSLSRRHAEQEMERGSKFKEGSMNDKPSILPPSLFTRDTSNHSLVPSAHSANVDHLMEEYNGGHLRQSIEPRNHTLQQQFVLADHPTDTVIPLSPSAARESTFYRFGRAIASSFNPGNVWGSFSRTFKDTKDDLTLRNIEENRKKDIMAQQKAQAEAKYAEMKAAGTFGVSSFTVVSNQVPVTQTTVQVNNHEQDTDMLHHAPALSATTDARPPKDVLMESPRASESTRPGSPSFNHGGSVNSSFLSRSIRSRKSIFGLHRPSFATLKRNRSDYNLGTGDAAQSNSSLSPEKRASMPEAPATLSRSHSKKDLGKQRKLSQRVSDLELKLADARRELGYAINNASPLPDLPSRFEKYTPNKSTPLARFKSKFIPGQLPSLPSERLLFSEQGALANPADESNNLFTPAPRDTSTNQPRVSQIFDFTPVPPPYSNTQTEALNFGEKPLPEPPIFEESTQELDSDSDPDMIDTAASALPSQADGSYEDLDARLKALDQVVEGRYKKKSPPKKRKDYEDKDYKPGQDTDEDEAPKKFKRRKSTSKSSTKSSDRKAYADPATASKKTSNDKSKVAPTVDKESTELPPLPSANTEVAENDLVFDAMSSDISSLGTSPAKALEPIYEEDSFSSSKHDSGTGIVTTITKTKHIQTSSRSSLGQYPPRSRSASPVKNRNEDKPGNGTATHDSTKRSGSPPPDDYSQVEQVVEEVVTVTPGVGSAPEMPSVRTQTYSTTTTNNTLKKKTAAKGLNDDFEWPEDVF